MKPSPKGLVKHTECKAGVNYESVGAGKRGSFICVGDGGSCPKYEPFTEAQLAEQEANVERLLQRLRDGLCPTCEKPIEPSTIVGRCRYGACGHRIGQVATGTDE
jgi:hypothetical protein